MRRLTLLLHVSLLGPVCFLFASTLFDLVESFRDGRGLGSTDLFASLLLIAPTTLFVVAVAWWWRGVDRKPILIGDWIAATLASIGLALLIVDGSPADPRPVLAYLIVAALAGALGWTTFVPRVHDRISLPVRLVGRLQTIGRADWRRVGFVLEIVSLTMAGSAIVGLIWTTATYRPEPNLTDDYSWFAWLYLAPLVPIALVGVIGLTRWWRRGHDTALIGYDALAILVVAPFLPSAIDTGLAETAARPIGLVLLVALSMFLLMTGVAALAVLRSRGVTPEPSPVS